MTESNEFYISEIDKLFYKLIDINNKIDSIIKGRSYSDERHTTDPWR